MDRIITRRRKCGKLIGYIREIDCKWSGHYYILFTADGNCFKKSVNYNELHTILYNIK